MAIDAAMIAARRAAVQASGRRRKRLKQVPKSLQRKHPRAQEIQYVAFLRMHVRAVSKLIRDFYGRQLKELTVQADVPKAEDATKQKIDSPATEVQALTEAILKAAAVLPTAKAASAFVSNQALAINTVNEAAFAAGSEAVIGIDLAGTEPWFADAVAAYRAENQRLITSMTAQQISNAEGIVLRGINAGERASSMAVKIAKSNKVSLSRATLIARDQTSKFYGNLSQLRQTGSGLTEYIWRTSLDDLVRDEHVEREGVKYKWSNPPDDGHPGQPINCRCNAEPVFDDLLKGL